MKPRDRQIASLVARGCAQQQVAALLGLSAKTIQRALANPDVRKLAEQLEDELEPDMPALNVLRDALTAVKRDGSPDFAIRIAAARTLMQESKADRPRDPDEPVRPGWRAVQVPEEPVFEENRAA